MGFRVWYEWPFLFNLRVHKKDYNALCSITLGLGCRGTKESYCLTVALILGLVCLYKNYASMWCDRDNRLSWCLCPRINIPEGEWTYLWRGSIPIVPQVGDEIGGA